MDATGPVLALLKKLGGYSEEDVQALFAAGENRLMDLKAICHGGPMSDGAVVPGMGAVYQAVVKMAESHNQLAAEMRAMRAEANAKAIVKAEAGRVGPAKLADNSVSGGKKAPVKLAPREGGQTGVKQQRKEG